MCVHRQVSKKKIKKNEAVIRPEQQELEETVPARRNHVVCWEGAKPQIYAGDSHHETTEVHQVQPWPVAFG